MFLNSPDKYSYCLINYIPQTGTWDWEGRFTGQWLWLAASLSAICGHIIYPPQIRDDEEMLYRAAKYRTGERFAADLGRCYQRGLGTLQVYTYATTAMLWAGWFQRVTLFRNVCSVGCLLSAYISLVYGKLCKPSDWVWERHPKYRKSFCNPTSNWLRNRLDPSWCVLSVHQKYA